MEPDLELEAFKTQIDLRAYATSAGYVLDQKKSGRTASVMRADDGDKINVRRLPDGHYVYYSFRQNQSGSIIDFVQHRKGLNLGEVRKELRPWIGVASTFPNLRTVTRDFQTVSARLAAMVRVVEHPYLEHARGIPASILAEPGVVIYRDDRGNAIFPHYDVYPFGRISGGDPCGYEIKNAGFTGFAPGGMKGLWTMFRWCPDVDIVICESAIDCLSYAALFPEVGCLFASIGGQLSEAQGEMITSLVVETYADVRAACEHVGQPVSEASLEVIAAMDSDAAGSRLVDLVLSAAERALCPGVQCYQHVPEEFKDWNEQLVARERR